MVSLHAKYDKAETYPTTITLQNMARHSCANIMLPSTMAWSKEPARDEARPGEPGIILFGDAAMHESLSTQRPSVINPS